MDKAILESENKELQLIIEDKIKNGLNAKREMKKIRLLLNVVILLTVVQAILAILRWI